MQALIHRAHADRREQQVASPATDTALLVGLRPDMPVPEFISDREAERFLVAGREDVRRLVINVFSHCRLRILRIGVMRVLATVHPLRSLRAIRFLFIPVRLAQSETHIVSPLKVNSFVLVLFLAC